MDRALRLSPCAREMTACWALGFLGDSSLICREQKWCQARSWVALGAHSGLERGSKSGPQAPPPTTDAAKQDSTKGAAGAGSLLRESSSGLEVTPGPGAYSPEKVAPVRQRTPPAFTLGSRLRPQPLDTSAPAPNTYTLPSLWGAHIFIKPSSPSYTVAGRPPPLRPAQDPAEIPGPGQYESPNPDAYRQRLPAFTMPGRARALRPLMETPGPGTHSPEHVTVTKARAPAFTMGIRHSKRASTMGSDTCSVGRLSTLRPREVRCKALVGLV
ncbi:outer dense fiber protein 3-like protein 2 isoform X2 [Sorex araneus]|uniref:outer dense fiber protein 3-like protein 2 isoform X2 n=1 Tax=Sorex araneus TaxID=42254 RepID=UPI0024336C01|nr:outer dense fiber protein 3-like protein 2 isoform X2 [Sorex araneus]